MARLRRAARRALRAFKKIAHIFKPSKPEIHTLIDCWGHESVLENANGPEKHLVKGLKRGEALIATRGLDGVLTYSIVPEHLELLRELPKIKITWKSTPVASVPVQNGLFQRFEELPEELRVEIWKMSLPEAGGTLHIQAIPATFNLARSDQPKRLYDRLTFHHCPYYHTLPGSIPSSLDRSLSMLSICKESRKEYGLAFPLIMPLSTCRKKDGQCICKFPTYPICHEHSTSLIPYEGRVRFSRDDAIFIRNFQDLRHWITNQWITADAPNWKLGFGVRKLFFNLELVKRNDTQGVENLMKFIGEFEALEEVVFVDKLLPPSAWDPDPLATPHGVVREVVQKRDNLERWDTMGGLAVEGPLPRSPIIRYEDLYKKFRNGVSYAVEVLEPGTGGMKYVKEYKAYGIECSCNPDGSMIPKPTFETPSWWDDLRVPREFGKSESPFVTGGYAEHQRTLAIRW